MSEEQKRMLISLGITVKTRRHEMRISQEELASRSGLHRTYISDVERGARNVSLLTLNRIANALNLELLALLQLMEIERSGGVKATELSNPFPQLQVVSSN